jgi:hypothetical protein
MSLFPSLNIKNRDKEDKNEKNRDRLHITLPFYLFYLEV